VTSSDSDVDQDASGERRALGIALWLNVALSAGLMTTGMIADSSGLIANALDNTSDAAVYAIGYYATTRGAHWKARAAKVSGVALVTLSIVVVVDVARRFVSGSEPRTTLMVAMTVIAAIVNVVSLKVLSRLRRQEVHLRAAWTFSINDFISNLGVLVAAMLVAWLERPWPDLVIGLAIAVVVGRGGFRILADVRRTAQ
jgi:Co/Zn/Cd efflux system component